jgi:hypothetical protein
VGRLSPAWRVRRAEWSRACGLDNEVEHLRRGEEVEDRGEVGALEEREGEEVERLGASVCIVVERHRLRARGSFGLRD